MCLAVIVLFMTVIILLKLTIGIVWGFNCSRSKFRKDKNELLYMKCLLTMATELLKIA
jgi:hypothetical protein